MRLSQAQLGHKPVECLLNDLARPLQQRLGDGETKGFRRLEGCASSPITVAATSARTTTISRVARGRLAGRERVRWPGGDSRAPAALGSAQGQKALLSARAVVVFRLRCQDRIAPTFGHALPTGRGSSGFTCAP